MPVHNAIGASLLGVVATSTTSAAAYLKQDLSNVKLGMTLETMTVGGALAGGLVGAALSKTVLSAIFGAVMICVSVYMGVRQRVVKPPPVERGDVGLLRRFLQGHRDGRGRVVPGASSSRRVWGLRSLPAWCRGCSA